MYGKVFADRGYISPKLFDTLFADGIRLVHGIKINMKNRLMPFYDKMMLRKRYINVSLFSCSNEKEFSPVNEKVIPALAVSKMSDWLPNTRSTFDESGDMPVLHFKDEQAYNETIAKLNEMDKEECDVYFKTIGFDGAYTIWNHVNEELEQIFKIEIPYDLKTRFPTTKKV